MTLRHRRTNDGQWEVIATLSQDDFDQYCHWLDDHGISSELTPAQLMTGITRLWSATHEQQ